MTDTRFDTTNTARLKRGWRTADVWLASLLALLGWTGGVIASLNRETRLEALRQVRRLEALVRRLALAMAAQSHGPAFNVGHRELAPDARELVVLSPGLAQHWTPPSPQEPRPPMQRQSPPPTIRLLEPWPDMSPGVSDRPFDSQPCRKGAAPRIRSILDAPLAAEPVVTAPQAGPERLLARIEALRAVIANPDRMVRRMTRWLSRRPPGRNANYRPTPLGIGLPRMAMCPDMRDVVRDTHLLAHALVLRRDSA